MAANTLNHFDESGNAWMVDVSGKNDTAREAVAQGSIQMTPAGYNLVKTGEMAKGDVLGVARIAGIMAAKRVDRLIPLAHPLSINKAEISFEFNDKNHEITIKSTIKIVGKTGVEMEALTAVSIAALTIYDMSKAVDKGMIISDIKLLKKTGGKSGNFIR